MAKNGFKVLDSDMHILEPPDLWQRFIDSKFKDYAPRGTTDHVQGFANGGPRWARHGADRWTRLRKQFLRPGHIFHRNQKLFKPHMERGWSSQVQLGSHG